MNPCCELLAAPVPVGRDGEDEFRVVASRVGLKRRDEAFKVTLEGRLNVVIERTLRCQMRP